MIVKIIVFVVAYLVGVFGFSQIVGGLQNIKTMGVPRVLSLSIFWLAIIGGFFALIYFKFNEALVACIIPYAISFIKVLFAGKIE